MDKQALLSAAGLFEKKAAGPLGTAIKGAFKSLSNKAYDSLGTAGNQVRDALFGKGIGSGYGKLRKSISDGVVDQDMFNKGLAELAKGVGRTGAVYGGGLYAGSKLLGGGGQPQEPYYYG